MAGILIQQPFANAGDLSPPPQTDPQGFVNWQQGYTPSYEINLTSNNPQAKAVERQVQNSLFNQITANLQAWQQFGFAPWFSNMPGGYGINAQIVRQNAQNIWIPFRSLVDNNVSDPLVSPASWEVTPKAADVLANIPMPAGGASGSQGEIVTVATDFNTFGTGSWEFKSDAVAAASAHSPSPLGGATAAGLLECKVWSSAPNTFAVQRYTDRNGNGFFRGYTNGTWGAWSATAPAPTYSTDTSVTPNLVSATFPLSSAVLVDNAQFWVKIANANNGAVTFTPNPVTIPVPLPLVGQANLALQGGEIVVGGRALIIYKADTNNFVLAFCSGGALQVAAAIGSGQAVSLGQVQTLLTAKADGNGALYQLGILF